VLDRLGLLLVIRPLLAVDWPAVEAIYAAGIASGNATFEASPPNWESFDSGKLAEHRLVFDDGRVLGWAAASPISTRDVYRGVVEHSVYVSEDARGRGIGRQLLQALIASTEAAGVWTIQSGVFPENEASLRLHEAFGFRRVGIRDRIAKMTYGPYAGQWRDVVLIERRSELL
jgi:phosphinothricin acetyltransferase